MTEESGDVSVKKKALQNLAGIGPPAPLKPGEMLKPNSGYPEKFIQDYNAFQKQYQEQRDSKPQEYWDYGQSWWGQVKDQLDRIQENNQNIKRGNIIKLMRPSLDPKQESQPPAPQAQDDSLMKLRQEDQIQDLLNNMNLEAPKPKPPDLYWPSNGIQTKPSMMTEK